MKKLTLSLITLLITQNVMAHKQIPEALKTQGDGANWASTYGYQMTPAPVYVETNPEALYFERQDMKRRLNATEQRLDSAEYRLDNVEYQTEVNSRQIRNLQHQVTVLNYRVNDLGWRVDLIGLDLSNLKSRVSRIEYSFTRRDFGCQFGYIIGQTPLMPTTNFSWTEMKGSVYDGEGKVEILRHGTYDWRNNSNDSAVLVRVVSNWAGKLVGQIGFINGSALKCM